MDTPTATVSRWPLCRLAGHALQTLTSGSFGAQAADGPRERMTVPLVLNAQPGAASDHDDLLWRLLVWTARLRLATGRQLHALTLGHPDDRSARRRVQRGLVQLIRQGLMVRLPRRLAGRPGQFWSGFVYGLTSAGGRALGNVVPAGGQRRRLSWSPSAAYLEHRLAIGELAVQLVEAERRDALELLEFTAEPDCWRRYADLDGRQRRLKPDALVRVGTSRLELSWFVEVDLSPRSDRGVGAKSRLYRDYELSGQEQRRHDVFPRVLFVVPDQHRQRELAASLHRQPSDIRDLFAVTTAAAVIAGILGREDGQ